MKQPHFDRREEQEVPKQPRQAPRDLVHGGWPDGDPLDKSSGIELLQAFVRRIRRATNGMSSRAIAARTGLVSTTVDRVLFTGAAWPDWYTWTQLELKFGVLSPEAGEELAFALQRGITRDVARGVFDHTVSAADTDDPLVLAAYTIKEPLLEALAGALGEQCQLDYKLPVNAIYLPEGEQPFDPSALPQLRIDLYDPDRHLAVHFTPISKSFRLPEIRRFHDIYTSLGILDAIQMQYDTAPPRRALLMAARPQLYWRSLAVHTDTNLIYPAAPNDLSSFHDVQGTIFANESARRHEAGQTSQPSPDPVA
ncbi:MAG TPA: hypothetical protein VG899_13300 [Mycobacteriales bacterium]|nr:hypothetical protein [Mycobacteriales bacterium]